jgi:hypothetical protein
MLNLLLIFLRIFSPEIFMTSTSLQSCQLHYFSSFLCLSLTFSPVLFFIFFSFFISLISFLSFLSVCLPLCLFISLSLILILGVYFAVYRLFLLLLYQSLKDVVYIIIFNYKIINIIFFLLTFFLFLISFFLKYF